MYYQKNCQKLFIVSKENPKIGSKLILRGTWESKLIFCCLNCEDSELEIVAVVYIKNRRIFAEFDENSYYKNNCYKINLKETLSNEERILINKI